MAAAGRLLIEQLQYNLLFRWFGGLSMDEAIWVPTIFTKNRDRLLAGEVATAFFGAVLDQARAARLLSDEHFTVDGTLFQAWAGRKSFRKRDGGPTDPPDGPGNATVDFRGKPAPTPRTRRRPNRGGERVDWHFRFVAAT